MSFPASVPDVACVEPAPSTSAMRERWCEPEDRAATKKDRQIPFKPGFLALSRFFWRPSTTCLRHPTLISQIVFRKEIAGGKGDRPRHSRWDVDERERAPAGLVRGAPGGVHLRDGQLDPSRDRFVDIVR